MADNTQLSAAVGSGDTVRDKDRSGIKTQIVGLDLNIGGSESLMAGYMPIRIFDGTNTVSIRDTGASDSLNVAIVDASGNQITTFGGGTQYTEGDVDATITGNVMLMEVAANVIQPIQGTVADGLLVNLGTNNDVTVTSGTLAATQSGTWNIGTLTTITNVVHVDDNAASLTVDNGGTFAVQVTSLPASTGTLEVVGDVAHDGVSAGNPVLLGGYASATAPTNVSADGDVAHLWCDLAGRLQVGDGGGSLTVDNGGTFAVQASQAGTWTVQPGNTANTTAWLVTGTGGTFPVTDSGGSLTVDAPVGTPAFVRLSDGSAAITTLPVSLASVPSHAVTNAGTFVVQVDGSALTSLQLLDDSIYVDDADWTDDTSKHVLVGGVYQSVPHTVTDGDVTPFLTDVNGRLQTTITGTLTVASHAVTNAGTFVVQENGAALTALQLLDDTVATDGSAVVTKLIQVGGTDGTNAQIMSMTTAGLVNIADGSGSITVDNGGTFAVQAAQSGTWNITNVSGTISLPTGASTATLQSTGNTALSAIQVSVELIDDAIKTEDAGHGTGDKGIMSLAVRNDVRASLVGTDLDYAPFQLNSSGDLRVDNSAVTQPISAASLPLPTGASTAANQSTMIGHLDGVEGILTTMDADTGNISTKIDTLAGAVAGVEMQVDIVGSLPAGTAAIGKLASNSGVDIGDVDVTSILPGTGATNLGKAEDAAHTTGDVGVMTLTVRQDTAAALAGTDADYQPLITDALGRLHVNIGNTITVASHAVTNAGTFATQITGDALTSLQLLDNAISGAGFNITQFAGTAASVNNGAADNGTLRVSIASNSTGAVSASQSGSWTVGITSDSTSYAEDAVHASGDLGKVMLAVRRDTAAVGSGTDGDYSTINVDASGRLWTHVGAIDAGETHVGEIGGKAVNVAVEVTRPADTTAYTAGDVVSDSTSTTTVNTVANFARISGGTGYVTGARLTTDKKSITPRIRIHLYNASTPTVAADNAAMKKLYADEGKYLGYFDFVAMITGTDTTNSTESASQDLTLRIPFITSGSRSIFFIMETLDAFTPASAQKFTLRLWGDLD